MKNTLRYASLKEAQDLIAARTNVSTFPQMSPIVGNVERNVAMVRYVAKVSA